MSKRYEVYVDGSCIKNPGPMGYGIVIVCPDGTQSEISRACGDGTNQRAELIALIEGLKALPDSASAITYTDSKYIVDGLKSWLGPALQRGGRTTRGKSIANGELWEELVKQLQRLEGRVSVAYIPRNSHVRHERADGLARLAARSWAV